MSFAQPSLSRRSAQYLGLSVVAVIAAAVPLFGSLVTTNIFVVAEEDPITEDVYVTARTAVVDGLIDGDLTVFSGNVTINGEVTGDVIALSSATVRITEDGRVGGALRGAAVNFTVSGSVGTDVFATGASVVIEESGTVGRDVMAFGGVARVEGAVGRDVRGRTMRTVIDGSVGGDIDVATQRFEVGADASIDGDILYRSPVGASIDPAASIAGTVTRLPTQSNFVYGVILTLANVVGFLGFVLAGLVALLVLRGSGARATGAMITNPVRSFLYGLIAVFALPAATIVLAATLVGIPLAIILVGVMVAAFVVGPVPAVTALGNRVLVGRGGLFGGFLIGAVLWRLGIWVIPVVGGFLYLIGLVWGIGAWIVGFIETRRGSDYPVALLPPSLVASEHVPDNWEPPLAPVAEIEESEPVAETPSAESEPVPATDTDADPAPDASPTDEPDPGEALPEPDDPGDDASPAEKADESARHDGDAEASWEDPEPEDETPEQRRARFDALVAEAEDGDEADSSGDDSDEPPTEPNDNWGLPTR